MGTLTRHLQDGFLAHCPRGWTFRPEAPLVDPAAARRLGFDARVDGLFEHRVTGRRLWIEFEVSRADPVANHAKFATARHLEPSSAEESFVSMTSRHIQPGRYALAAGAAMLMRSVGIPAFQTSLLPALGAEDIRRLNHDQAWRVVDPGRGVDMGAEVARALQVGDTVASLGGHRIHKADNVFAVNANVRRWNLDIDRPDAARAWGRRRLANLVQDSATGLFAPAKYGAFVPAVARGQALSAETAPGPTSSAMTIALYATLGERDPRFDGHVAWRHLQDHLGYRRVALADADPAMQADVAAWAARHVAQVALAARAFVLVAPTELRGLRRTRRHEAA